MRVLAVVVGGCGVVYGGVSRQAVAGVGVNVRMVVSVRGMIFV